MQAADPEHGNLIEYWTRYRPKGGPLLLSQAGGRGAVLAPGVRP